jgi:NADH-quinone oxidoreductase subunit J
MMTIELLTYILGGMTIACALLVILSKHPVRSVLYLVLTFFMISGHYILLNAQFLAIVNIIVYAGAIMVLFLFVLMLLNLNEKENPRKNDYISLISVLSGGALFLVILSVLKEGLNLQELPQMSSVGLVEELGNLLFTKYVLPFEISSILFLSAMVGALLLARKDKKINEHL